MRHNAAIASARTARILFRGPGGPVVRHVKLGRRLILCEGRTFGELKP